MRSAPPFFWAAFASLTVLSFASPLIGKRPLELVSRANNATSNGSTPTSSNPCAQVASAVRQQTGIATPTAPAKIAWECITSIPLNSSSALELIASIRPYLEWQSTTAFLKDPPAEYIEKIQPPVDLWAGLDAIESNVRSGAYKLEYDFGWTLYCLFQSAHDGHLAYVPDSVGNIFNWGRPVALVSVSQDGQKLPGIFTFSDILASSRNPEFTPSPVSSINGEDATTYIEKLSQLGQLQDRDALYNNMFYELAQVSLGVIGSGTGMFSGGGRGRWVYPGPETKLTFTNGTTRTYENFARVLRPFNGVNSTQDVIDAYFYYESSSAQAAAQAEAALEAGQQDARTSSVIPGAPIGTSGPSSSSSSGPVGYPTAIVREPQGTISGYYLDDIGYEDVAVLSVPSFVSNQAAEVPFQNTGSEFLARSRADGKTKLIIDVSANGGGTIIQAYDLFKQLFPSIEPYGASRYRAQKQANLLGQKFSEVSKNVTRSLDISSYSILQMVSSPFNYRTDETKNGENFDSWKQKYGPHAHNGDEFTSLLRWNLSDPLITIASGGIEISGYGNRTNVTQQPFTAEDVVIVYDGYCGSTCTIFSELMRRQAGVKAVAMGGRPRYGAIQAVGGTKGVNNFQFGYIQLLSQLAYEQATPEDEAKFNASGLGAIRQNYVPYYRTTTAMNPNINVRDGLRRGDDDIPLQFQWEAANCRLFWTQDMVLDITKVWESVADAVWGDMSKCVDAMRKRSAFRSDVFTRGAKVAPRSFAELDRLEESLKTHTDLKKANVIGDGLMLP